MSHLFFAGIRVSTLVGGCAFGLVAYLRLSLRPFLPLLAWLAAFDVVYQTAVLLSGHHPPGHPIKVWVSLSIIAGSGVILVWTQRLGVRAEGPLLLVAAAFFLGWIVAGFHVNGHNAVGFQPFAEAMNEGAKTAFALAYFIPLVRGGLRVRLLRTWADPRTVPPG